MTKNKKDDTFETKLAAAESIISLLEKGDLTLDESMKEYKKGFALLVDCEHMLQQAETEFTEIMTSITQMDTTVSPTDESTDVVDNN